MKWLILLLLPFQVMAVTTEDLKCLTDNIYFEARGEPMVGQAAVGYTVINRMKDKRWPNSICDVVYQKKQFSWTMEKPHTIRNLKAYSEVQQLAYKMLDNVDYKEPTGVNHYLRCDIRDKIKWTDSMILLGRIGNHCFYVD